MKALRMLTIFFVGLILEWLWSSHFSFFHISPQVLLVLTSAVSLHLGPVAGQCYGFFWGLCEDAWTPHTFGANALLFTMVGYFIGNLRRQMDVSSPISQGILAALITPAYFLGIAVLGLIFEHNFLWAGWSRFSINPFYNGLIAPLGFGLIRRWFCLSRP